MTRAQRAKPLILRSQAVPPKMTTLKQAFMLNTQLVTTPSLRLMVLLLPMRVANFNLPPVGIELDAQTTIYVRAAEWDSNLSDLVSTPEDDRWLQGATQSIPVTLVAPTAPTVTNLKLVRETGGTGVSSDATISGEITGYSGGPVCRHD